jgi:hypothetical protein
VSAPGRHFSDIADIYRHTFAPRLDAYADWTTEGDGHWYAVRSPLTIERVTEGLKGGHPVSAYMESSQGETHVGAIDFDRDDGWELGLRTAKVIDADGGHAYVERSRRGCHLWLVTEVLPGSTMRQALRYWVSRVSPEAARDPKTEIMPKPVQRGPDTLGHALRMPMMAHQRTGERHPLCDSDGKRIGGTVGEAVLAFMETPGAVVRAAAGKCPPEPVNLNSLPPALRPARPYRENQAPSASALLAEHWGVVNAQPGRTVKCPVHPSPDKHPSLSITRDDERVYCHDPECQWNADGRGLGSIQLERLAAAHP